MQGGRASISWVLWCSGWGWGVSGELGLHPRIAQDMGVRLTPWGLGRVRRQPGHIRSAGGGWSLACLLFSLDKEGVLRAPSIGFGGVRRSVDPVRSVNK